MSHAFDHPWLGGLLGDAETADIWSPERQMAHMLAFEAAYTRAMGATGVIPGAMAEDVATQIEAFWPCMSELRLGTARDGVVVPDLVRQLKRAIGGEPHAIHSGATSQDVIDTALALTLKEFNRLLADRLAATLAAIENLSAAFGENTLMGRTRMQAALPIKVQERLLTWSMPLNACLDRLETLGPRVELLQLGGAVGDRAALEPHADAIAADVAGRLGLGNPPKAWHAMRGGLADYAGLLSLISGALGKMGQDICLMAQQGIDEISLGNGGGSSAMPHKQNPVQAELLITLARFNATQVSAMHHALLHEQERSGAAWTLEWLILPQMAQATARGLGLSSALCAGIKGIGSETRS